MSLDFSPISLERAYFHNNNFIFSTSGGINIGEKTIVLAISCQKSEKYLSLKSDVYEEGGSIIKVLLDKNLKIDIDDVDILNNVKISSGEVRECFMDFHNKFSLSLSNIYISRMRKACQIFIETSCAT